MDVVFVGAGTRGEGRSSSNALLRGIHSEGDPHSSPTLVHTTVINSLPIRGPEWESVSVVSRLASGGILGIPRCRGNEFHLENLNSLVVLARGFGGWGGKSHS